MSTLGEKLVGQIGMQMAGVTPWTPTVVISNHEDGFRGRGKRPVGGKFRGRMTFV